MSQMLYPRDERVRHLYGRLFGSNSLVPVCTLRLVGARAGERRGGRAEDATGLTGTYWICFLFKKTLIHVGFSP